MSPPYRAAKNFLLIGYKTLSKPQGFSQLVLLRHGQSIWNRDKVFTGWSDVPLSPKGEEEAKQAGNRLSLAGYTFDICFSSELRRSIDTLQIVLSTMKLTKLPVYRNWRLNERHYGALEGIGRWQAIRKFGFWPVLGCQICFDAAPPPLDTTDPRFPGKQSRYAVIKKTELPRAESMQQTLFRLLPYWQETIVPELLRGKRILIVSHKNILRTLIMQLANLSPEQVMKLSMATGQPLVYELDQKLKPISRYYIDCHK